MPTRYVRDLGVTLKRCTIWSDGRVRLPDDAVEEHDLGGAVIDAEVDFGPGTFPLTDAEVTSGGNCHVIRIPKHVRERYGVPCGNGATVDLTVTGVIVGGE